MLELDDDMELLLEDTLLELLLEDDDMLLLLLYELLDDAELLLDQHSHSVLSGSYPLATPGLLNVPVTCSHDSHLSHTHVLGSTKPPYSQLPSSEPEHSIPYMA